MRVAGFGGTLSAQHAMRPEAASHYSGFAGRPTAPSCLLVWSQLGLERKQSWPPLDPSPPFR